MNLHNFRRVQVAESEEAHIFKIQIDVHWTIVSLNDVHFGNIQRINADNVCVALAILVLSHIRIDRFG